MSAHQKLTPQSAQDVTAKAPQTTTQRTAAHRRRMAEKMARYEGALDRAAYVFEWLAENEPNCFGHEPPFPSDTPSIKLEAQAVRDAIQGSHGTQKNLDSTQRG